MAANPLLLDFISKESEIDAAIGGPADPKVRAKVINALDGICESFIARSPFIVVCSSDVEGRVDVSPKGDPAGFVQVLDARTIAIPERLGNRRADTFRNVLQNPKVGLIFIIPGKGETLRVSGSARIVRDAWLLGRMAIAGRLPSLALVVTVEEAFLHCTKCMVRSGIWRQDTWNPSGLASIGEAMVAHGRLDMTIAEMQSIAENDAHERLY